MSIIMQKPEVLKKEKNLREVANELKIPIYKFDIFEKPSLSGYRDGNQFADQRDLFLSEDQTFKSVFLNSRGVRDGFNPEFHVIELLKNYYYHLYYPGGTVESFVRESRYEKFSAEEYDIVMSNGLAEGIFNLEVVRKECDDISLMESIVSVKEKGLWEVEVRSRYEEAFGIDLVSDALVMVDVATE